MDRISLRRMVDKMTTIIRHGETCLLKMNGKSVEAVVDQFVFETILDVVVNKSVKLKLKWNGRCYEGRSAGLDIYSDGPKISRTQTAIRGNR
jgi:hypothetical protein